MKILAFAASNSSKSINKKLVTYALSLLDNIHSEILDLNDYELPLYSEDREADLGQPRLALDFLAKIKGNDAIVISFAEHNGTYSVAYKNIFDWCSRIDRNIFQGKPMVFLATSPGAKGASTVLVQAVNSVKFFDGDLKDFLSIPSFNENFDSEKNALKDEKLNYALLKVMENLIK